MAASSASLAIATAVNSGLQPANHDIMSFAGRSDMPVILRAPDGEGASEAPPASSVNYFLCVFDCGPPRPVTMLTNTGTSANPRWMCRPCNNARKAMEWMVNKDAAAKDTLIEIKKNDPELWKAKVRATRVREQGEPAGLPGVDSLQARKAVVIQFNQFITQRVGVTEQVKVKWFKKNQYVAHMKYKENMSEEEANQTWEEHFKNRDIQRRGEGPNLTLAMSMAPSTLGFRTRETGRTLQRGGGLESLLQAEKALESLAAEGASQASLSSSTFGPAGEVFRVGGSGSADLDPVATAGLPQQQLAPPPSSSLVAVEDFAPFGSSSGGEGSRGLAACVSDPANPKRSSKRRRVMSRSGITGDVAEAAEDARESAKATQKRLGSGRANLAKQLEALADKTGEALEEDTAGEVTRYQALLTLIAAAAKAATSWTASDVAVKKASLEKDTLELTGLAVKLSQKLSERKDRASLQNEVRSKAERASNVLRERKIRGYVSAGAPPVLARWLYHIGAIGAQDIQQDGAATIEENADDGSQSVGQDTLATLPFFFRCAWHTADLKFDGDAAAVFSKDAKGPGEFLRQLAEAYGEPRITKASEQLVDHLIAEQAKGAAMGNSRATVAMLRLPPKGIGSDTVEALNWVPKSWRDKGIVLEATRSYGAPWLLAGSPGSVRYGHDQIAFPGMGRFLSVVAGSVILVTFPVRVLTERGATMARACDWLWSLALKTFSDLATMSFRVVTLTAGCGAWVPYGHMFFLVTPVSSKLTSQVLDVVFFAGQLLTNFPEKDTVLQFNQANTDAMVTKGEKPWNQIGQPFLEWLKVICPTRGEDDDSDALEGDAD